MESCKQRKVERFCPLKFSKPFFFKKQIMTTTLSNNKTKVKTCIVQSEAGSHITISNSDKKIFEYFKPTLDLSMLKFLNDKKLLSQVNPN